MMVAMMMRDEPSITEVELVTDFSADSKTVARDLIGRRLVRIIDGRRVGGRIVETEAYLGVEDRAAHSYGGRRTARNEAMYLPGGHAYVYFIYGMHYCMNVVCAAADDPQAVLIRAIEPEEGIDLMSERRPKARRREDLTSGPAKLTSALAIDRGLNGASLVTGEALWIEPGRPVSPRRIVTGPRVGIGYAGRWARRPLRYADRRSSCVSKPRPGRAG